MFCFKSLHLGHLAKSFALRDPPSKLTGIGGGKWVLSDERKRRSSAKREETVIRAQKRRINQKALVVSEFQSGFEGIQLRESAKVKKAKGDANKKKSKHKSKQKRIVAK